MLLKQEVVKTIISEYMEQQFCIPLCIYKFNSIKDIEYVMVKFHNGNYLSLTSYEKHSIV